MCLCKSSSVSLDLSTVCSSVFCQLHSYVVQVKPYSEALSTFSHLISKGRNSLLSFLYVHMHKKEQESRSFHLFVWQYLLLCFFQLKHCGKQVYEVLLPLIKSIEPEQNQHLRHLIDKLDPACYNESVSVSLVAGLELCCQSLQIKLSSNVK